MLSNATKAVVLMNLGSPDSTNVPDVKKYLQQFLMDERVIDKSWLVRSLLVKGIIVPFRAPKSAEAYKTIWTKEGSPLVVMTKRLQAALQQEIEHPIEIAMRYGNPSPETAFNNILKNYPQVTKVIAVPLYPHYAMSSFETAVEYAKEIHAKNNYPFNLDFIPPFYNNPDYLEALAENTRPYLQEDYDHILFSYHGVPARHIMKSDVTGNHCLQSPDCCSTPSAAHQFCYRHQVITTTLEVTKLLNIPKDKYSISFQSRLGKGWLTPFTDIRLEEMPKEGIRNLKVICPAFVSDCLETLEEIAIRGKEIFINAGGEKFEMIPCLNVNPAWINALAGWVSKERVILNDEF